ncbi:STAS domain-containing protein [Schinkia sp. CFF1]
MLIWDENISLKNLENFKTSVERLLKVNTKGMILNLENVLYMNEHALGIIANAVEAAKDMNKELVIINNQTTLRTIFEMVHFYSIVQVFSHEQYAENYLYKLFPNMAIKVV